MLNLWCDYILTYFIVLSTLLEFSTVLGNVKIRAKPTQRAYELAD